MGLVGREGGRGFTYRLLTHIKTWDSLRIYIEQVGKEAINIKYKQLEYTCTYTCQCKHCINNFCINI